MSDTLESLSEAPRSILVPIATFAPEPFEVIDNILVVVQPTDDEYTATFFDANIHASGDTQEEAVANLKDIMLILFKRFDKEPEDKLGPEPRRQLAVLRSLIRKLS